MFPNYLDGATILTITHLAEDSENEFVKKIFARINQQPRRKHRGIKPSYNKVIELSCIIWVK